ncbi:MAG: alpha/beta hydrolase [Phyllobacteriaceae bacterium]|nr:alpha/beta hydrolase [Phyllobacteriaceae bacterium]MBA92255.1 alpha/beta hydrolase [Phyllobacteriaceae bacterium]
MFNLVAAALAFLLALAAILFGLTRIGVFVIERRHPPAGAFVTANATRMHHVHVPGPGDASLPPVVFIHGASGNLKDPMGPLRQHLEGKAELLFLDRPGHGWSGRGPAENATPAGQARTIGALMDELGMGPAVVVGHSFGGGVAAALALERPDKVAGLVFVSAASHPWPGGKTSWYYPIAARPVLGRLFSHLIALPAGWLRMKMGTACVFSPNPAPDTYSRDAAIPLVLRPANFRMNAIDVESLYPHVLEAAPRYNTIKVPTTVISGDSDTVVYEEIHSVGLAGDIPGARLVWVKNLGHKPDYVTPELVAAAIGAVAGAPESLLGNVDALAQAAQTRLAGQDFGPFAACKDGAPPDLDPEGAPAQ